MSRYGRNSKAERVEIMQTDFGSTGGAYRLNMMSTELTLVAAQTATLGHIGSFRNASSTLSVVVDAISCKFWFTVLPTVLQEFGLGLFMARSYTASHTGGAAATITTNNGKLRTSYPTLADISMRMGTTGALTAGTHTLDAQSFASSGTYCMAANAAAHQSVGFELNYAPGPGVGKILLAQNEGFVLTNSILGGTAAKWNVSMAVDFHVVDLDSTFEQ